MLKESSYRESKSLARGAASGSPAAPTRGCTSDNRRLPPTTPATAMKETSNDPTEAQERGAETGRQCLQPQHPLQPRGVITLLLHDRHTSALTGPTLALATVSMLNRVAALEGQINALTGPLFRLLTTPEPSMAPTLQDTINVVETVAPSFLSVHGHLTGLPQTYHTLTEAIHRVQTAQFKLILLREMAEHPTPRQNGGAHPGAEEPPELNDSEDGGTPRNLQAASTPLKRPRSLRGGGGRPITGPLARTLRPRNPAPGAQLDETISHYQGRGWGSLPEVLRVA